MGKKYKLSKKVIDRRPKERGPYKEKEDDPLKSTEEERDELFPGWEEMGRLSRGVVEDTCGVEEEDFVPPEKWGRLMSNDETTQKLFEQRLGSLRSKFTQDSTELDPEDVKNVLVSRLADRMQRIQDRHPQFLSLLTYLVEPLTLRDGEEMLTGESKANTPFSKLSPKQIQNVCKRRFGLMTLEDLLNVIDRIKRAEQGKKNLPQK